MAHTISLTQARIRARVWYEFVPSELNIADLPSRGDFSYTTAYPLIHHNIGARFVWFESLIPESLGLW